jgi:DNA-binding NarL/FixJ family response regulator
MGGSAYEAAYAASLRALRRDEGFDPTDRPKHRKPTPGTPEIELRRVKVLALLRDGRTVRQISNDLGVSYNAIWLDKEKLDARGDLKCK